jgi:hypothetical protein
VTLTLYTLVFILGLRKKKMIVPNIISNPKRLSRVAQLEKEMKRQGIEDYKLWPSVHVPSAPARTGVSRAHKQIVQWAADEGLEEVCIFEDDIFFPSPDGWRYFLSNKPKEYDLYLGGLTRGTIDENKITERYTGQFCYFIHDKYYDTFLRTDEKMDIDGAQNGKGDFHGCYPYACFCYPGWSDNYGGQMDYSHILIGKEIYGFGRMNDKADAKRFSYLAKSM